MASYNTKETAYNTVKLDGTSASVNSVTVTVLQTDGSGNILFATGTTVPTHGSSGYAKGAMFIDTDVAEGTGGNYLNKGTTSSSFFTGVTQS